MRNSYNDRFLNRHSYRGAVVDALCLAFVAVAILAAIYARFN